MYRGDLQGQVLGGGIVGLGEGPGGNFMKPGVS